MAATAVVGTLVMHFEGCFMVLDVHQAQYARIEVVTRGAVRTAQFN